MENKKLELLCYSAPDFFIPEVVLRAMVHTGALPLKPLKMLDERVCCRYARQNDAAGAAHCPMLATSEPHRRPWCRLNGERQSPCVFDEPDDAKIWARIEEQRQYDQD